MNTSRRDLIMQRWNVIQHELLPELRNDVGTLTPNLEKIIHTLEWVRIEEFVQSSWFGEGRPPHERSWLANAFVAKSVLGLTMTRGLIERLALRGFMKSMPSSKSGDENNAARNMKTLPEGDRGGSEICFF